MSEVSKNINLDNLAKIAAASLHGKYLRDEIYVEAPGGGPKVIGQLERFSIKAATDASPKALDDYLVKIVVSGVKLELKGSHDVYLMDGGTLSLP